MPLLNPCVISDGNEIYQYGQVPQDIYLIINGRVAVKDDKNAIFKNYVQGSYFGEIEIVFNCRRLSSTQAEGAVQMMKFSKKDFEYLMNQFFDFAIEIRSIADSRLHRDMILKHKLKLAREKLVKINSGQQTKEIIEKLGTNPSINKILNFELQDILNQTQQIHLKAKKNLLSDDHQE